MTCPESHSWQVAELGFGPRVLILCLVWTTVLGACSSRTCLLARQNVLNRELREVLVILCGGK